jgi:guanylate kinase
VRRLKGRDSDAKDEAAKRLLNAEEELSHAGRYEYVVVNEEFDKTVEAIVSIIKAERLKSKRLQEPLDIIKWRN